MTTLFKKVTAILANISVTVWILATVAILWLYHAVSKQRPIPGISILKLDQQTPEESWYNNPQKLFARGKELYPNQPFQVLSNTGPKLVLPQNYLKEVRASVAAEFSPYIANDTPLNVPGFDGFRALCQNQDVISEVVRTSLTQSLTHITESLVEEGNTVIEELYGDLESGKWHNVELLNGLTILIGRFTIRTMLGENMAHNPEYVDLIIRHAGAAMSGALKLRSWPRALWPIIHFFIPACTEVRQQVKRARNLITQEVKRREEAARAMLAAGKKAPKIEDSVAWIVDKSKSDKKLDIVAFQLVMSMASVHNTSGVSLQSYTPRMPC